MLKSELVRLRYIHHVFNEIYEHQSAMVNALEAMLEDLDGGMQKRSIYHR